MRRWWKGVLAVPLVAPVALCCIAPSLEVAPPASGQRILAEAPWGPGSTRTTPADHSCADPSDGAQASDPAAADIAAGLAAFYTSYAEGSAVTDSHDPQRDTTATDQQHADQPPAAQQSAAQQSMDQQQAAQQSSTDQRSKGEQRYGAADTRDPSTMTDADWQRVLTPEEYAVARWHGTEPAFTGKYWNFHGTGIYRCVCCGQELFRSDQKYDSGTGWPSFWAPIAEGRLKLVADHSHGMDRIEVLCGHCGAHLGHLFDDGPRPTGQRYCLNSASLDFQQAKTGK